MNQLISNLSRNINYYDTITGNLLDASEALFPKRITANDLDACLKNGLFTFRRTTESYSPVAGVLPIPGRTNWVLCEKQLNFHSSIFPRKLNPNTNLSRIDQIAERYLKFIKDKTVAIELSGGLDTALIIEVLKRHGINLAFVGFSSDRYEFRTERAIQDHYLETSQNSKMIDYSYCPAFAKLSETPIHAFPTADSLYHARHSMIADATKSVGANILLNGNAGDSLLCHGFEQVLDQVPQGYDGWCITDVWSVENIFKPQGISYLCPFALDPVIRALIAIRKGQAEDSMKLWARKNFSELLPFQLSQYAYKANHDGWVAEGLRDAENEIKVVVNNAQSVTKHPGLNFNKMINTAMNYFHATTKEKHEFLLKLSFAVWVHGFVRENFI